MISDIQLHRIYSALRKLFCPQPRPRGGVHPEKLGGDVRPASQNSYPFDEKNCDISYLT